MVALGLVFCYLFLCSFLSLISLILVTKRASKASKHGSQDGGPLKYLSFTRFEKCCTELLRDFYMDNEYRKQWDKTVIFHNQLQVNEISGTEVGRTIKKFPLFTPREYVLAWRVWEGHDKTFYCFIKVGSIFTFLLWTRKLMLFSSYCLKENFQ